MSYNTVILFNAICALQLAYAFVPLQLKSDGARAVVRAGCIDASLAAGRLFRTFVDVWAKVNSVQLRLSDIVFSREHTFPPTHEPTQVSP